MTRDIQYIDIRASMTTVVDASFRVADFSSVRQRQDELGRTLLDPLDVKE